MSKKLKFGFICTSDSLGGLELSTYQFGKWLKSRGHEVHYIISETSALFKYLDEFELPYDTIKKGRKYFDLSGASQLSNILKQKQFEHYIITLSADIDLCALTKTFFYKNFKFYYFQEMQLGVNKKGFFFNWKFGKMEKWITPLHWLHKQVLERTNVKEDKIIDAPLSIEIEKFRDNNITAKEAKEFFNIPQTGFVFGFVGRIDPAKNPLLISRAFRRLLKERDDIHLVVIGEKTRNDSRSYADDFEAEIQDCPQIHRRPFSDKVHVAYRAFDAFIMATSYESIGLVTIEAMASKTLVIGANGGGTKELLDYGNAGYLFEPDNEESLYQQMKAVVENNNDAKKELALKRASELYSSHITCDRLEEMISS